MGRGGTAVAHVPAHAHARRRALDWSLPVVGFGAPLVTALVAILLIAPYFGIVDDGLALALVHNVGEQGFFHAYGHAVWDDARIGGQVRPFYWALEYVEYRAGLHSSTVLYLLNWLYTGICLAVAGLGLAAAFRIERPRRSLFLAVYGAAVFVFPWTLDLFAFPSPQERSVALAAGLAMLWLARPRERIPAPLWYAISAAVVVLGSLTKATFLVFAPVFVLQLLDGRRRGLAPWSRVGWVAVIGVGMAVVLRIVGAHGGYTDQFSLGNVRSQAHSRWFLLFTALSLVWIAYALLRRKRGAGTLLLDLIPPVAFAGFAAVYLQWQGWVFYLIAPVVAGAFALLVVRLPGTRLAAVALAAAVVWAVTWTVVRTNELYSSLHSIGEFARSQAALALARSGEPVYISCQEGSQAIAGYVAREQGAALTIYPNAGVTWGQAKDVPPPPIFRYALADEHLCPARIDHTRWRTVWRPTRSTGFTLYRRVP
jgi:hypothetical protein